MSQGWSPALWLRRAAAGFDMPEAVAVEPLAMADAQVKQAIGKDRVEVSSGCYINPDWLMIILGGLYQ